MRSREVEEDEVEDPPPTAPHGALLVVGFIDGIPPPIPKGIVGFPSRRDLLLRSL